MRSIRARTTGWAALVVAVALVLGALGLLLTLRHSLVRSDDALAQARAKDIATMVSSGRLPRTLRTVSDDSVTQVVGGSGDVLAASPSIAGQGPITGWIPATGDLSVRTLSNVPDDDETDDYRVWAIRSRGPEGPATIYVGTSLESVQETIGTLRTSLLVGLPVLLTVLAVGTWFLIGRALRPVDAIRSEVATISHEALDRRVPVPPVDDEIARLASTMNDMLDRLEASSGRQREFVGDASHELQSPLASLRAQLEVALAYPDGTDWLRTAEALHAETGAMEALVRDLLFLARADDATSLEAEPVDLDDIVLEEVARLRPSAGVHLDSSAVSAGPARGRRGDLSRLVRNLLENAVAHAATTVRVELSAGHGLITLAVADDGPGVALADRARVFDRFYRADRARSRSGGGTGLGLAIARSIAERHGGSLELDEHGAGARFVLWLPEGP